MSEVQATNEQLFGAIKPEKFVDCFKLCRKDLFSMWDFRKCQDLPIYRSSLLEVFCERGVLRNFAKFTGKHLCQRLSFNKVAGLKPATLLKKRLWHRCFPVNIAKFLRTHFFTEHLRWLLLYMVTK